MRVCQESRSTNLIKLAKVSDLTILHNLIKRREDLAQDFSLNQVSLSPCLKSVENLFFLDCFDTSKGFYSICCLCPDCSLFSLWFICSQFILSPTSLLGSFSSKWLSWGGGLNYCVVMSLYDMLRSLLILSWSNHSCNSVNFP